MNALEKFKYWESKATYDLETARAMQKTGRYNYVVFMAQQAIEKIVKGLYVLFLDREPARTHNIWLVLNDLLENEGVKMTAEDVAEATRYKPFFSDLLFYYISERYPDYKQQLSSSVTETKAGKVLTETEEVYVWLLSLSRYKN